MEEKIYEIRGRKFRLIKPDEITLFEMIKLGKVVKSFIESGFKEGNFDVKVMFLATLDIYSSEKIVDIIATLLKRVDFNTSRGEDYNFLYSIVESDIKPEDAKEIYEYFLNFILKKLIDYCPYSTATTEIREER